MLIGDILRQLIFGMKEDLLIDESIYLFFSERGVCLLDVLDVD